MWIGEFLDVVTFVFLRSVPKEGCIMMVLSLLPASIHLWLWWETSSMCLSGPEKLIFFIQVNKILRFLRSLDVFNMFTFTWIWKSLFSAEWGHWWKDKFILNSLVLFYTVSVVLCCFACGPWVWNKDLSIHTYVRSTHQTVSTTPGYKLAWSCSYANRKIWAESFQPLPKQIPTRARQHTHWLMGNEVFVPTEPKKSLWCVVLAVLIFNNL